MLPLTSHSQNAGGRNRTYSQTHVYLGFTVQCPAIGHLRPKTLFLFAWPQKEKAGKLQMFLLKRPARPKNP